MPSGSARPGAKAMAVVLGEADVYVHDGGMYQWDSAAPAAVALAAGLHVSRLDGTPIVYNHRDPWLPDFIVCRPELADAVHAALWDRSCTQELTAMELKATRLERDGHVATIWLHRPHRHNAWTGRMHAEYRHLLAELEADVDVRVVVRDRYPAGVLRGRRQRGAGRTRRSGWLRRRICPTTPANPGYGVRPEFDHDFAFMFGLRFPVIAAVNGAAAGVGLAAALYCDLRFGSATAKLTTAAPKLGLPAEYGMSWVLPRLVGVTRAADLLLSGRVVTGAETADWGLWNGVGADGDETLRLAHDYAVMLAIAAGPNAVAMTKRQLYDDLLRHDVGAAVDDAARLLDDGDGHRRVPRGCRRAPREAPTSLLIPLTCAAPHSTRQDRYRCATTDGCLGRHMWGRNQPTVER